MSAILVRQPPPAHAPTKSLRSAELFTGIGGLALGLARAGFEMIELIERDEACCETLRANAQRLGVDSTSIDAHDTAEVDFTQLKGVDLLAAGAPCQPFSRAGQLLGHIDDRNMFPEVIRAVREAQPRAAVIENVRGLLFKRLEPYFKSVLARLRNPSREPTDHELTEDYHATQPEPSDDDEYRVYYTLLDAADFGLAQHRPRLFIVLLANGEPEWTWPAPSHDRDALIEALLGDKYWKEHGVGSAIRERMRASLPKRKLNPTGRRWRTLRDLTAVMEPPAAPGELTADPAHVLIPGARLYARHTGSRLDWVAKTVKAGVHGTPGGEHILLLDDGSHRYLTLRECARLQGFPGRYELPKLRTPAMRQLGNAVPVAVAEAIGWRLKEVLTRDGI